LELRFNQMLEKRLENCTKNVTLNYVLVKIVINLPEIQSKYLVFQPHKKIAIEFTRFNIPRNARGNTIKR
jgi:hypothetical protein